MFSTFTGVTVQEKQRGWLLLPCFSIFLVFFFLIIFSFCFSFCLFFSFCFIFVTLFLADVSYVIVFIRYNPVDTKASAFLCHVVKR